MTLLPRFKQDDYSWLSILRFFAISTKTNARIMLLEILIHSMAGSVTFCFDSCFVKWFQHVSSVIIRF